MLTEIEQSRRHPSIENTRRLREYFERNPSRVWVLQGEQTRLLLANWL